MQNKDYTEIIVKTIQDQVFLIDEEIKGKTVDISELIQELEQLDQYVDELKNQQASLRAIIKKLAVPGFDKEPFKPLKGPNGNEMSEQEKNELFRSR